MAALMETIAIPSVTRLITVSSGAAVYPVDALTRPIEENPYGYLKRQVEDLLSDRSAELGVSTAVARAWSVSGSLVQKPASYALTDMIAQAKTGHISISATRPVYRRYSSVEDLLSVALAAATNPGSVLIDSGGELVEMSELAQRVIAVINPAATVSRPALVDEQPNEYYAADEPWQAWCAKVGLIPSNLDEQIRVAARAV
jgi:nucleoside-diphosphate-sugar epimerase